MGACGRGGWHGLQAADRRRNESAGFRHRRIPAFCGDLFWLSSDFTSREHRLPFNGESVLAGDPLTGTKAPFPDVFTYIAGTDIGITQRLTVAFDILGQRSSNAQRMFRETYVGTSWETIGFRSDTLHTLDGAIGIKYNPFGGLLLNCNLMFQMNDSGLRDKLTPLFGAAYTF